MTLEPLGDHPLFVTEETIVTYEAIWNGPFAFTTSASDAQWYNMSIRSDYVVGKQDSEPYYPEIADDLMLSTPEYQWAFGGNPYHLKVYNRSTGLREVLTLVDNNAVMREGDYTWDLLSNKDGFVLRVPGTAYTCLNQIGGYRGALQGWNSSNSPYDNGSTFRVMPALPVDVEDIYALTDDRISGRQTSGMYDLSGRRVSGSFNEVSGNRQWIDRPKKGVYIVQGRKVVVK